MSFSPRSLNNPHHHNNKNNNNSSNNNKRQLIRPTNLLPWSVDVVSAVPGPVAEILDTALSGATHHKWACLAFPHGIFYVWYIQQASSVGEDLHSPKEYLKLVLPDFLETEGADEEEEQQPQQQQQENGDGTGRKPPLVALTSPHGCDVGDAVQFYALHPITGCLVLKKISRRDMRSKFPYCMTHTARTRILRDLTHNNNNNTSTNTSTSTSTSDMITETETEVETTTYFRSLMCYKSMVIAGTSQGDLYWITHIAVPVSLHVQKVEAQENNPGYFSSFFGSSSSSVTVSAAGTGLSPNGATNATTMAVPLSGEDDTKFLAVSSKTMGVVLWTTELPIASGHHVKFSATPLGSFTETITVASDGEDDWKVQEVIRAAISFDHKFLHCIVRGTIVESGESRLYWVVARVEGLSDSDDEKRENPTMTIVRAHWLSRFAYPDQVRVVGLVSCENDNVYAALSADNTVIIMALVPGGEEQKNNHIIQEVDLPTREVPNLLPHMMERDTVTFGCYVVASSGIGMRVNFVPRQQETSSNNSQSPSKRPRLGNEGILGQHLRSYFWTSYQDPTVDKPVPPSLTQAASSADLELAIIQIGAELQQKGDPSSYSISIDWHNSFVKLLQDCGLYRCLSEEGKWKLFGIGQEVHVFGEMSVLLLQKYKHQEDVDEWQAGLRSHSVADWLLSVQESVDRSRWLHAEIWYDILGTAVSTILVFHETQARPVYDVASERSSEPLWISHRSLQDMLSRQMKYWEANPHNVALELIELVVKTALLSNNKSLSLLSSSSSSSAEEDRMDFVKIQKASISLLRLVSDGHDELAFDLCQQYRYFDGLCELSVAHGKKQDALSYALDPLFDTMKGTDLGSGRSFSQHVLQWHTDRGLFGQVINYGRHSVSDLNRIMEKNIALRQYRWIPTIRQGYYAEATGMLLENCQENNSLVSNEWALSMAKLANKIAPAQNKQAKDQKRHIDTALELVDAHKMLLLDDDKQEKKDHVMMQPKELIELVMKKLDNSFEQEESVRLALVGLVVCSCIDDDNKFAMEQTARIWAESLLKDGAQWTEWALEGGSGGLGGLRDHALSSTVFGRLLEECRQQESSSPKMTTVTYGRDMETVVIDRVQGDDNREAFTRVLRTVAVPAADSNIRAQSLLVASFS